MNKSVCKISWQNSIWFSDIDDTLITTADSTHLASDGIKDIFTARFGYDIGTKIQDKFMQIFNTMLDVHRGKEVTNDYLTLVAQIEGFQKGLPPVYGKPKKWSREIFIAIAAKQLHLNVSDEFISEAADAYWMKLTKEAAIIPGVLELVSDIKKHNRPFYLVTGSDARLKRQAKGQFGYDPSYSEDFKRARISLLQQRGINFNLISIGDPEDKPHRDFFDKAIRIAELDLEESINTANAIMIGDSYTADLKTPKEQMGFGLVVLYQPGKENTEVVDEHQINTGNIFDVVSFIDE